MARVANSGLAMATELTLKVLTNMIQTGMKKCKGNKGKVIYKNRLIKNNFAEKDDAKCYRPAWR